jgi:hypothetical protein
MFLEERHLFLPGMNERRHKSIEGVYSRPYYTGLLVESEEHKLFVPPTHKRLTADKMSKQCQLK